MGENIMKGKLSMIKSLCHIIFTSFNETRRCKIINGKTQRQLCKKMLWKMWLFVRYKVISRTTINKEHINSAWNKTKQSYNAEEQGSKMIESTYFQKNNHSIDINSRNQMIQYTLLHLKHLKERDILSSLHILVVGRA